MSSSRRVVNQKELNAIRPQLELKNLPMRKHLQEPEAHATFWWYPFIFLKEESNEKELFLCRLLRTFLKSIQK
jgi:hypothetical protein